MPETKKIASEIGKLKRLMHSRDYDNIQLHNSIFLAESKMGNQK